MPTVAAGPYVPLCLLHGENGTLDPYALGVICEGSHVELGM